MKWVSIIILSLLLVSCGKKVPEIIVKEYQDKICEPGMGCSPEFYFKDKKSGRFVDVKLHLFSIFEYTGELETTLESPVWHIESESPIKLHKLHFGEKPNESYKEDVYYIELFMNKEYLAVVNQVGYDQKTAVLFEYVWSWETMSFEIQTKCEIFGQEVCFNK